MFKKTFYLIDHVSTDPKTSGYVTRHSDQKNGKTKKKKNQLMIELLQKVMLGVLHPNEKVFQRKRSMLSSLNLKVRNIIL
jgi:hypothetical protein